MMLVAILLCSRLRRSLRIGFVAAAALSVFTLLQTADALAADGKAKASVQPCGFSDDAFDIGTDVHAFDNYQNAIALLLKQEQFAELDCVADAARAGKAKFSGGSWKLRIIYLGLESPGPQHATDQDWKKHLQLIERWRDQNPRSVTAPIALAQSYVQYAWFARGEEAASSVSDSGWKLFHDRTEKAKSILDHSAALSRKCPEWYLVMEFVAQAESWDLARFKTLVDQAAAFEPGYQYYFNMYANYLQPRWSGAEGDAARFAEVTADKVGGDAGDLLYFQIAAGAILCACQESEFGHFSWPRLQKGFAALEKIDGPSLLNLNSFALMAVKSNDWIVADPQFKRMGDNWSKDTWRTEEWFKQNRDTAAQMAPLQANARAYRKEAEENMKTAEGRAYEAEFQPKFVAFARKCADKAVGDQTKMDFLVQIGKDGSAEEAHTEERPSQFTFCLMQQMYKSYLSKETPFPVPPRASYRMVLVVDPTILKAAAK